MLNLENIDINYCKNKDKLIINIIGYKLYNKKVKLSVYRNNAQIYTQNNLNDIEIDLSKYINGRFRVICRIYNDKESDVIYSKSVFKGESVFNDGKEEITYYLDYNKSNYMAIVFSAMIKDYNYIYNYVNCLENVNINKLYILDNKGRQGCYYLGENGNRDFEEAVTKLINHILEKFNIKKENTLTIGSSKGGYSALYYSIKLNLGYSIVGAPQFLLGNFLYNHYSYKNRDISKLITGNNDDIVNIIKLNDLIYNLDTNKLNTHIHIIIGKEDDHYIPQFFPLLNFLINKDISHTLYVHSKLNHKTLSQKMQEILVYILNIKEDGSMDICRIKKIKDLFEKSNNELNMYSYNEILKFIQSNNKEYSELNLEALFEYFMYLYSENEALKDDIKLLTTQQEDKYKKYIKELEDKVISLNKKLDKF